MRARVIPSAAMLLAAGFIAASSARPKSGTPATYADLEALANRDMATPQGKEYDTTMGKQFAGNHVDGVTDCVKAAGPDLDSFKAVITVGKDGKVTDVTLDHDTELARCIRKLALGETFPRPPFAPFHDLMDMNFKE